MKKEGFILGRVVVAAPVCFTTTMYCSNVDVDNQYVIISALWTLTTAVPADEDYRMLFVTKSQRTVNIPLIHAAAAANISA
jgi:hypothetical protein